MTTLSLPPINAPAQNPPPLPPSPPPNQRSGQSQDGFELRNSPADEYIAAVVLSPMRELTQQIAAEFQKLATLPSYSWCVASSVGVTLNKCLLCSGYAKICYQQSQSAQRLRLTKKNERLVLVLWARQIIHRAEAWKLFELEGFRMQVSTIQNEYACKKYLSEPH